MISKAISWVFQGNLNGIGVVVKWFSISIFFLAYALFLSLLITK